MFACVSHANIPASFGSETALKTHLATCPQCGHEFTPRRKQTGRIPGVLETGSVADRVVNFLHDNPHEELTADDISVKFNAAGTLPPRAVSKRLAVAVRFGYLETTITSRGKFVYRKPRDAR